jgi:hypothetical protein
VRRGDRAWKEIEGEKGGSGGLSSDGRRVAQHVERGENGGPGNTARCAREGGVSSGKTRGRWARAAAGEQRSARPGAGRRWGKRGRERGGWQVGRPIGWAASISETRRAGERLAGGPGHEFN